LTVLRILETTRISAHRKNCKTVRIFWALKSSKPARNSELRKRLRMVKTSTHFRVSELPRISLDKKKSETLKILMVLKVSELARASSVFRKLKAVEISVV